MSLFQENVEDIKGVIASRKSKDARYNSNDKTREHTKNLLLRRANPTKKLRWTQELMKVVLSVVLLIHINDTNII